MAANTVTITDPTVTNDSSQGFAAGSIWTNLSNGKAWVCTDATVGAAVWVIASSVGLDGIAKPIFDTDARQLLETILVMVQTYHDSGLAVVDQGSPGTQPWKVDASGTTVPVTGTVAVTGIPPVTGQVTAIQVSSTGLVATVVPQGNDVSASVYDADTRRLLEEILLELRLMRQNEDARFGAGGGVAGSGWPGMA